MATPSSNLETCATRKSRRRGSKFRTGKWPDILVLDRSQADILYACLGRLAFAGDSFWSFVGAKERRKELRSKPFERIRSFRWERRWRSRLFRWTGSSKTIESEAEEACTERGRAEQEKNMKNIRIITTCSFFWYLCKKRKEKLKIPRN